MRIANLPFASALPGNSRQRCNKQLLALKVKKKRGGEAIVVGIEINASKIIVLNVQQISGILANKVKRRSSASFLNIIPDYSSAHLRLHEFISTENCEEKFT